MRVKLIGVSEEARKSNRFAPERAVAKLLAKD